MLMGKNLCASYANQSQCVIFLANELFQPLIGRTIISVGQSVEIFDTFDRIGLTSIMRRMNNGFTLIELLITLVIATILVTIAVPNFSGLMQNNRLVAQTNSLITDLNYARSEAIKRGASISVTAEDREWTNGWTITLQGAADTDFLRRSSAVQKGLSIASDTGDTIEFSASGNIAGIDVAPLELTICDSRGNGYGRIISIEATGRLAITKATDCA